MHSMPMPLPTAARYRLWQVDLDATPAPRAVAALSDAEWDRARRFVFKRDRERFVAAHAALRDTLSSETGIPAAMLEFRIGPFGKPTLVEPAGLGFNLSHSGSTALIAVCEDVELGVDVEVVRPMADAQALAELHFTPAECRALRATPPAARDRAFLTVWTRKEACIKALGTGLSLDLRTLEVGLQPGERSLRCEVEGRVHSVVVASIPAGESAVGAVAFARLQAESIDLDAMHVHAAAAAAAAGMGMQEGLEMRA